MHASVGTVATSSLTLDTRRSLDALHAATPPRWFVGRPGQRHGGQWEMYAFDRTERPKMGHRSHEWVAVASDEVGVVREMARCLVELGAGRIPK